MSRGYTPRHAQTAGDLSFAVQFNAETLVGGYRILKIVLCAKTYIYIYVPQCMNLGQIAQIFILITPTFWLCAWNGV